LGILLSAQAFIMYHSAEQDQRIARLERIASYQVNATGRLEERCLERQAAVDLWLQSIRLAREDHLDKFVAWLGKAVR
jgi:hypothetical protein